MKKKGFTSMQARFIVIIIIVALISAVGSTAFSIVHSIQGNREQLAEYRHQIETDVEMQLKMETQIAVSLIDQFYQKQLAGERDGERFPGIRRPVKLHARDHQREQGTDGDREGASRDALALCSGPRMI